MPTNYYATLGVSKNADEKEIKRAYRKLARQHHPDLNPGDKGAEKKFKEINEANEVLSDPENRAKYDRYGDNWRHADQMRQSANGAPFRWSTGRGGSFENADFSVFGGVEDLLGGLGGVFSGGRRRGASRSHVDVQVEVSLEEAFSGTKRQVSLPGSAGARRIELSIPPGVKTGSRVHIAVDKDTQLFLRMTVTPHTRFRREGNDLYTDVDVPFEDAILGGDIDVQTLKGKVRLKVPPESQSGQNIRLAGQGMPVLNEADARGDLYVTLRPTLVKDLSDEERELLEKFKALRSSAESAKAE